MSNYTITTNFGAKDSLPSTDAGKVIKGSEFTTEFTNIQTAIATKADTAGDTFTGVVNFSADVAVNTNTLFVDVSADKVGIGTTSPDTQLHVYGSGSGEGTYGAQITIGKNNGCKISSTQESTDDDKQGLAFFTKSSSQVADSAVEAMRIDESGNVGIGTGSPASRLAIDGAADVAHIVQTNTANSQKLEIGNAYSLYTGASGSVSAIASDSTLAFATNDAEKMRIDSSGNVGIGTTSPQDKLHVSTGTDTDLGNIAFTIGGTSTSNARTASITKNTSTPYELTIQAGNHATSNMETVFKSSDSKETMRIDASGNVGIGTTSPDTLLEVVGADPILTVRDTSTSGADSHATLRLAESGASDSLNLHYDISLDEGNLTFNYDNNGSSPTERMRIDSFGNVLVGKTSSGSTIQGAELHNSGSIFSVRDSNPSGTFDRKTTNGDVVQFRRDGTTVGSVSATSSATSYNTSSDERLKENITDSADAGSKVDSIQIRQFDWKADGLHQDYGVIAQELINVAPEAVSEGDTEEDMMGVDYSKLVPMLIKEVQSLRSRVAELENV